MKKIGIIIVLIICLSQSSAFCESYQFGVVASGDSVRADFEVQTKQTYGIIAAGGAFSYSSDEYKIGEGLIALRSDRFLPGLQYGLGFKGFYGKVEEEDSNYKGTLAAIGFLVDMDYELTSAFNPVEIPIVAYAGICFSPSPLSFDDTDKYQEYRGGLRFHLLESAYISVECKYRKFHFNDSTRGDWERSDTIFMAGLSLRL